MSKPKTLRDFLSLYPVISRISVKWGDMDAYRHLNNTVFFRYQEVARLRFFREFLKEIDTSVFDVKKFDEGTGLGPILSTTSCTFRLPITYPDKLLVSSVILPGDMSHDRYKLTHTMWSMKHDSLAAVGHGVVVSYNFETGKVEPIPEAMRTAIEKVSQRNSLHLLEQLENLQCLDD